LKFLSEILSSQFHLSLCRCLGRRRCRQHRCGIFKFRISSATKQKTIEIRCSLSSHLYDSALRLYW